MNSELKKAIKDHLVTIESPREIYELFQLLDYPEEYIFDESYKRKKDEFDFRGEDSDRILEIYQVMFIEDRLLVFFLETKTLTHSFIRRVTEKFETKYRRLLLIFASPSDDYSTIIFVLPQREKVEIGKYKLKLIQLKVSREEIRDRNEHYTVVHILSKIRYENENPRELWKKWLESFSVKKVTEDFFDDYTRVFFDIREQIKEQGIPQKEAHEFTLQMLNRIMFTYFIAKKKWLKYPNFMKWYWEKYREQGKFGSDEFYDVWLKELFFKAFNNRQNEIKALPHDVKEVLSSFPYLNGGLFKENEKDKLDIRISDEAFKSIFDFFEKYNFTIKESAPFDVEVAVDPQMIGYVYESLSNVAEEIYDRRDMGIFYTPRVEVDFMCRRALVEYLSKKMSDVPKEQFYHFIFDLPEKKDKSEEYFTENNLWDDLRIAMDDLSVADPACGSGAFLVGMLNVLDELYRIIYKHTNVEMTDFERKYSIIKSSLYGVDVMPWAIHAAELRLWLQLIIETELKSEELRTSPLLPNFDLNLRVGDSLVQEIGGTSINLRTKRLNGKIREKLEDLKHQKELYYENSRSARLKNPEDFKNEEIKIFEEIIDYEIRELNKKLKLKGRDKQVTFKGKVREDTKTRREINKIRDEIKRLEKMKETLEDPEKKPFIWEIDFAEIFGEKGGFDIVIGNPPYVRQENISPPNRIKSEVSLDDKREYKDKLIKSVKERFPMVKRIDKRSDYYIYFYFHGLSLLNDNGTFCFITSNSWLDVGYGKALQEFLLEYIPIIAIYDNPKRSFEHADVNTIIALFGSPKTSNSRGFKEKENEYPMLNHTAKFVMFKKPFEPVINPKNLIEIENTVASSGEELPELAENIVITEDYRVFPVLQKDLLRLGSEKGTYKGDKWGGKYLRAPDIYFKILKNGKNSLVKLRDIAQIHAGIITGNNKYYYKERTENFNGDVYSLVFKSPKEVKKILLTKEDASSIIKVQNVPFKIRKAPLLWVDLRGDKHICHFNQDLLPFEHNFYGIWGKKVEDPVLCLVLNSTISWLLVETLGRKGLGGGAIRLVKKDLLDFPIIKDINIDPSKHERLLLRDMLSVFKELGIDPNKPIRDQEPNPLPDRKALDDIVFDALGLTADERKEVYWAVAELVKQRLDKAKSIKR